MKCRNNNSSNNNNDFNTDNDNNNTGRNLFNLSFALRVTQRSSDATATEAGKSRKKAFCRHPKNLFCSLLQKQRNYSFVSVRNFVNDDNDGYDASEEKIGKNLIPNKFCFEISCFFTTTTTTTTKTTTT